MGHTHGYTLEDEFRVCGHCGKKLPQTTEYFNWAKKDVRFQSICKTCQSELAKKRNEEQKNNKPSINRPVYEGTKECICCHRELPNDWMHFPTDKTTKSGLRNKCRECTPNYGHFLPEDTKAFERWSEEDIELLRSVYADCTGKEIQEKYFPNRTVRSIECQAETLGFSGKSEIAKEKANMYRSEVIKDLFTGRTLNEEWRAKISATKKEYFKTHDGWWKSKKRSEEQCKQMSERMKGNWAGDKNPRHINPLNGEANGRWKGGINKTYFELRSDTKQWQQDSMKFCDYKCVITNGEFDEIHHVIPFRDIVDESFEVTKIPIKDQVMNYSTEEFELLRNTVIDLHITYGYGACMNKNVHKLFHDTYGYTEFDNTNFLDFINRIELGEFNEWFKDNNLQININKKYIDYIKKQFEYQAA